LKSTVIQINKDLNLDLIKRAKQAGCRISLGTDSHGAAQLRFMEYSAAAALMAGVPQNHAMVSSQS
jgi:histidinol phosphatase-like PHP family hydrolase